MRQFKLLLLIFVTILALGCDQIEDDADSGNGSDTDSSTGTDSNSGGDTAADVECEYNGETYKNGDSFMDEDGCNTCGCIAIEGEGVIVCTEMACVEEDLCMDLNEADCLADTGCESIPGQPVDSVNECYGVAVFTGCQPAHSACGDAIVTTTDPDGECWLFMNTCIPKTEGWNKGGTDMGNNCAPWGEWPDCE